ncbi:hypothetical protein PAXRUDRAFT_20376 [Paxillus rubicundulus Ve08.2h10]|uniref:Uncharacterized protein n=1 Tax=Paxillus rubicundulus Ve08.2h10 TaxID=930991 RepID=A0A0D0CEK7_9AGAM|nr:hypothetical protein PAXRUDRAFT_20376 [Paxillus rubicundulus Ve08.2h10]
MHSSLSVFLQIPVPTSSSPVHLADPDETTQVPMLRQPSSHLKPFASTLHCTASLAFPPKTCRKAHYSLPNVYPGPTDSPFFIPSHTKSLLGR